MPGPTRLSWAVLLMVASLSGCLEQADVLDVQSQTLEGTWNIRAIERDHGCPEMGSLSPVDTGAVTFSRDGAGWLVRHGSSNASAAYREVEPGVWSRAVSTSYEGCDLWAEARWAFDRVIESRFSASYSAVLTLSGESCEHAPLSCTVDYALSGLRRR